MSAQLDAHTRIQECRRHPRQLQRLLTSPECIEVRFEVADHLLRNGRLLNRKRKNRDITIESVLGIWPCKLHGTGKALYVRCGRNKHLHGIFGLDPLPAGRRPSRAIVESELDPVLLRLADCRLPALPPFIGKRLRIGRKRLLPRHEHVRRSDAKLAHSL